MKIDPPFPDFMQSGVNSGMSDLTSSIESSDDHYSEIKSSQQPEQNIEQQTTQAPPSKPKYKIQNLFWLINTKPYDEIQMEENEALITTINFNADFGNLRFELYNVSKEHAVRKNLMFLSELDKLIDGVIYPADCFNIANNTELDLYPMEQLITCTNEDWQKTRPIIHVHKTSDVIRLSISTFDEKQTYIYDFRRYQKDIFNYCCKYCVTTGMQLHGMAKL